MGNATNESNVHTTSRDLGRRGVSAGRTATITPWHRCTARALCGHERLLPYTAEVCMILSSRDPRTSRAVIHTDTAVRYIYTLYGTTVRL